MCISGSLNRSYIRTGRGFIDIIEKGSSALGISSNPVFILVEASPPKRAQAYDKIKEIGVWQALRIAGEVDSLIVPEKEQLD